MDVSTKEEMKALSMELFGASSRWKKLVDKGYPEMVTEEKIVEVDGLPVTKQVPVLKNNMIQYTVKRFTEVSVLEHMRGLKAKYLELKAKMLAEQEARKKKEADEKLAAKVQEEASGSSV